jgi:probable phosphoglycerate mutase
MTELWLIRHGETFWNAEGRFQGQLDVPLSPKGMEQAVRVAERLGSSRLRFDGLYSSDLERARETARPIAQALKLELLLDERIREIDAGQLQGLLRPEIEERFPQFFKQTKLDPWNAKRPAGESMADVALRVCTFLHALPEGRFAIVTHGGVIRAALREILKLEGNTWRNFQIQNTSITRLNLPEGTALSVGDVGHLEAWADHLNDEVILR